MNIRDIPDAGGYVPVDDPDPTTPEHVWNAAWERTENSDQTNNRPADVANYLAIWIADHPNVSALFTAEHNQSAD